MHREKFDEDYEFNVRKTSGNGYSISLPHQCDEWEIIGAEEVDGIVEYDDSLPSCPTSKEFAVKQMELFCKRANEALEKLKLLD